MVKSKPTENIKVYNNSISNINNIETKDVYITHYYDYLYIRINHIHITHFYDKYGNFLYSSSQTFCESAKLSEILYEGSESFYDY